VHVVSPKRFILSLKIYILSLDSKGCNIIMTLNCTSTKISLSLSTVHWNLLVMANVVKCLVREKGFVVNYVTSKLIFLHKLNCFAFSAIKKS